MMDVDDDLQNIELDFGKDELLLPEDQIDEIMSCDAFCDIENLDQIRCLGAPFLPEGQKHRCMCNEWVQSQVQKRSLCPVRYYIEGRSKDCQSLLSNERCKELTDVDNLMHSHVPRQTSFLAQCSVEIDDTSSLFSDIASNDGTMELGNVEEILPRQVKQRSSLPVHCPVQLDIEDGTKNCCNRENTDKCRKLSEAAIKKKNASLHLHEFLLELLNTGGCESYIHWTVQERKEFKIARPQRVAAMWGDRKNRKLLSDDKLTRALRYSIKKGKLEKTDSQLMLFRFTSN